MVNKKVSLFSIAMVLLCGFINASVVQAKDIPGAAETSYGVSANGAFQFQVPIVIPQGVNGVQPNLSLSFSSSRSNGMAGVGWGLSGLGEISRCPRTIVRDGVAVGVQHSADDRLCLNGQPLILSKGTVYGANATEYRTEVETFTKVVAYNTGSVNVNGGRFPTWFRVWNKDGSFEDYGRDADGRYKLPGTNSIHSWKVTRVFDRNHNYYRVKYTASTGLPSRIDYTLNDISYSPSTADAVVTFVYQTRPDKRTSYVAGRAIVRQHRLHTIAVQKSGKVMRRYDLAYQQGSTSGRSRITSITEKGLNGEAMPPIAIKWKATTDGFDTSSGFSIKDRAPDDLIEYYAYNLQSGTSGTTYPRVKELNRGQWADMNGDGLVDLVIAYTTPGDKKVVKTYLKDPSRLSGWTETADYRLPDTLRSYENAVVNVHPARFQSSVINKGQLVDVNGDGLPDLVVSYRVNKQRHQYNSNPSATKDIESVQKTYLNMGGWWQESSVYKPKDYIYDYAGPVFGSTARETTRGRFVDINGDGLVDWLTSYRYTQASANSTPKKTWLNNGNGWTLNTAYAPPSYFREWRTTQSWGRAELIDVNGDGLLDWVEAYRSNWDGSVYNTWLNTGRGWKKDNSYNLPEPIYEIKSGKGFAVKRGSFVDVNGDGLRDWVRSFRGIALPNAEQVTRINTGKGWANSSAYAPPFVHQDYRYVEKTGADGNQTTGQNWPVNTRGIYADVNRDGLVDFVQSYKSVSNTTSKKTWLNNGAGWDAPLTSGAYVAPALFFDYGGRRDQGKSNFGQFVDINSDTAPDWVQSRKGSTRFTKVNRVGSADWVEMMTTTMGVELKPEFLPLTANDEIYSQLASVTSGGVIIGTQPDSALVESPIYVVSKLHTSRADGSGFNSNQYHYAGLQVNRTGRGSLGFRERRVVDLNKDITSFTQYSQRFPYIGRVEKSAALVGDQTINASTTTYSQKTLIHASGKKTYSIRNSSSQAAAYELGSAAMVSHQTQTLTFDDYGNVLTRRTIIRKSTNAAVESDVLVTNTYKTPTPENHLVSLLETSKTRSAKPGSPTVTNRNEYIYDGRGRVTYAKREPLGNASVRLTTSYGYDYFGNIKTETQTSAAGTRVNTIEYDAKSRLPLWTENAKNHRSTIDTYHPQCDQPTKAKDANGLATRYEYDNFCRQTKETSPEGVVSTVDYQFGATQRVITRTTTGQAPVNVYYNRYNQATSSTTGMLGEKILQHTVYDRYGRTVRESQPFFEHDTVYYTDSSYDVLDRLFTTTLAFTNDSGGAAKVKRRYTTASGQRQLTVTDTKGRTTKTITNALGQVVSVIDANNKALRYYYDSQGNLVRTVDSAGNAITVGYDLIGRRTSLTDPDLGHSTYTYDAFSDLRTKTDAKLQTLQMKYDALGRLIERTVPGAENQSGGTSTWEYDTVHKGIGSLAKVTGPSNYLKTYVYDQFSRVKEDITTVKGQRFLQRYTYNSNGQLASRRYPNSGLGKKFEVFYNYTNGYLSSITDQANGSTSGVEHWRADKYDALGRTKRDTLGGLVTTNRYFDGAQGTLDRIHSTISQVGSGDVQDLNYTYDAVNNLKTRQDAISSVSESFQYDSLERLTRHTKAGQTTRVDYDDIGNITYKSDVGTYQYTQTGGPHALSKVIPADAAFDPLAQFAVTWDWDGTEFTPAPPKFDGVFEGEFTYDANGNIAVSGNRRFEWTAFDKPRMMKTVPYGSGLGVGSQSTFRYDPDFNRIVKRENNASDWSQYVETVYIGKEYERIRDKDGSFTHRYTITAGGNAIQIERQDNSLVDEPKYLLGDNLGSTNVIVNALGEVEQRLAFDPWGMRLNVGDTTSVNSITNRGYTGHEMDDEIGVINMNARIYDPFLGRFLSADPVLPDAYDMQSYNRYSYVTNNPLKYIDPTGNVGVSVTIGGGEAIGCAANIYGCIASIIFGGILDAIFGGGGKGVGGALGCKQRPECAARTERAARPRPGFPRRDDADQESNDGRDNETSLNVIPDRDGTIRPDQGEGSFPRRPSPEELLERVFDQIFDRVLDENGEPTKARDGRQIYSYEVQLGPFNLETAAEFNKTQAIVIGTALTAVVVGGGQIPVAGPLISKPIAAFFIGVGTTILASGIDTVNPGDIIRYRETFTVSSTFPRGRDILNSSTEIIRNPPPSE